MKLPLTKLGLVAWREIDVYENGGDEMLVEELYLFSSPNWDPNLYLAF